MHIAFPAHEDMRYNRLLNRECLLNPTPVLSLREHRTQHPPYKSHALSSALTCSQVLAALFNAAVCNSLHRDARELTLVLGKFPFWRPGELIRASFPLYVWAHGPGRGSESAFLLQTDLNAVLNGRRLQLCDTSSCKEIRPPLGKTSLQLSIHRY